ncbi:hypothetical protein [Streptomyces sp. NPDC051994]|uniref:hypothetical protein n=1 Tax=unclassified Streptomyces TaxID=2593676 RepID=UPI0034328006
MTALRGHAEELDPEALGGFHVRWYAHHGGRSVGPFCTMDEVTTYMTEHGLPSPDELLAPINYGR